MQSEGRLEEYYSIAHEVKITPIYCARAGEKIFLLIAAFVLLFIAEAIRSERRWQTGTSTVIMEVDKEIIPGLRNDTRVYTPLTLTSELSSLWRMLLLIFGSVYGSTTGVYFVSAFLVERSLRQMCYVYQACAGLADMLITGGVLPIATIVLISKVKDVFSVCQFVQLLTTASSYSYSIFFALLSGEILFNVFNTDKKPTNQRASLTSFVLKTCIIVTVFLFSITLASVGTYMRLDYDYCERRSYGNFYFRISTLAIIHGTCFILTVGPLIASYIRVEKMKRQRNLHHAIDIKLHRSMIILNLSAYLIYVAFWTPYMIIIFVYPNAEDKQFYFCAWVGVARTLGTSVFYAVFHTPLGETYKSIYLYCCCRASLYNYNAPRPRHRQYGNHLRSGGVSSERINIHLMQIAINPHSTQRASTSAHDREVLEL